MKFSRFATAFISVCFCALPALVGGCSSSSRASVAQTDPQAVQCPDCSKALDERGWCAQCNAGFAKGLRTQCDSCLSAIQTDGWCEDCEVGYVAGKKTTCESCFAAMTSPTGGWCSDCNVGYAKGVKTKCANCLEAIRTDGWCEDCKVGYVAGKKTGCTTCFAAMTAEAGGWCSDCGIGYAKGLETRCSTCFDAIGVDGSCQECGVRFQDSRSFQRVELHVGSLDSDAEVASLQQALQSQAGVGSIRVDREAGEVSFEVETTDGRTSAPILEALATAGHVVHVIVR